MRGDLVEPADLKEPTMENWVDIELNKNTPPYPYEPPKLQVPRNVPLVISNNCWVGPYNENDAFVNEYCNVTAELAGEYEKIVPKLLAPPELK